MNKCPGTRSGKKVEGMITTDVLIDLDPSIGWDNQKPVIACATAEILGGYVSGIGGSDEEGFYFVSQEDMSSYITFDWVYNLSWVHGISGLEDMDITTTTSQLTVTLVCSSGKKITETIVPPKGIYSADTILLLKTLVKASREGFFKEEECQTEKVLQPA